MKRWWRRRRGARALAALREEGRVLASMREEAHVVITTPGAFRFCEDHKPTGREQ